MLGDGVYQVFATDRGGVSRLGEITNLTVLRFARIRDDTSECTMVVAKPDPTCCGLLGNLRSGRHEVVVYRNGHRVWEGPVTRVSYEPDEVQIDARDISWYISRRALETTIDYTGKSYSAIAMLYEVLRYHFPPNDMYNFGQFITQITGSDDARTAAKYFAYSRTLFNLLDQYAGRGGVDYTVTGRRLILTDAHTKAHELPKVTDAVITGSVNVTEYGMELKTRSFVTNTEEKYSVADAPKEWMDYYGKLDFIDSNVDEGDGDPDAEDMVAMEEVAHRILETGYPAPVRLWIPDDSRLDPCYEADFNDLQAGCWVPVQSLHTCRKLSQWQKLQKVSVVWTPGREAVGITLTKAPNYWVEPTGVIQ